MNEPAFVRPTFDVHNPASLALDLTSPKPKEFLAIVEALEADIKANPELPAAMEVETGWCMIEPDVALKLLRRNRRGANRRLDPGTVFYYANQMRRGDWVATGQSALFSTEGLMLDAQHRFWACVVAGVAFKTYVICDIEPVANMFAFIDNSRARSATTALQTAGYNGVAASIVQVIKLAESVRIGVFNPSGAAKLGRMAPIDVLRLMPNYPNAQRAARSARSDWDEAVTYLGGREDVIATLGMWIIDRHSEAVADDFLDEVVDDKERSTDDPIAALRQLIDKDNRLPEKKQKPMKRQFALAALVKAFNAWYRHETLGRRWMLQVTEDFPVLDAGEPQAEIEATLAAE